MKVSFFHDVRLIEGRSDKVYSVDFGYEVWERYLSVFDEITVCTRVDDNEYIDISKYKLSSGNNVKFKLNRQYKSPIQLFTQKNKITKTIKEVVAESEACIIRLPSVIGVLAAEECIKQNKPWAAEVVCCCWDSLWNYGNIQGKLLAPIMYLLSRHYIKQASHVIYVSKEFLQKRYPNNNITKSASDVNIDDVKEEVLINRIEKIKNRDTNTKTPIILGLIGSLNVNYKGHKTAIKAIKELKENGYNVVLKCLGGGSPDRWIELCKKLGVENNVEFCGTLPSGEPVLKWIDNIDIFIMPSLQEGLPRSMVEAMSRGCNIIGTKTGGIPELIESDFIVNKNDYRGIAKIVRMIIYDKEASIKQANRNFIESKKYIKYKVDEQRLEFLNDFKESINNKS